VSAAQINNLVRKIKVLRAAILHLQLRFAQHAAAQHMVITKG
jgi:hypothetical protein